MSVSTEEPKILDLIDQWLVDQFRRENASAEGVPSHICLKAEKWNQLVNWARNDADTPIDHFYGHLLLWVVPDTIRNTHYDRLIQYYFSEGILEEREEAGLCGEADDTNTDEEDGSSDSLTLPAEEDWRKAAVAFFERCYTRSNGIAPSCPEALHAWIVELGG